ncbi:unnamed protein product [Peronospora belbahrii]|uniref:Uncharacterized protein n=1 Tax=Peronospora belbahrii TaxID=622444 RepID=A0AAU9KQN8_9STRA|nr:unnamed protein product [Peronospora belbahrii]CAH0514225.1 unnamed protein product [Peronospora belbahrii]
MTKVLMRDLMDVLNHGLTNDLTELFAIGTKRAQLIINERPFYQLFELEKVLGISKKAVVKLYEHHTSWENHQV